MARPSTTAPIPGALLLERSGRHPPRWASFDELVGKPQEVAKSYEDAVDALAARIAKNIREQFEPATARVSSAPER